MEHLHHFGLTQDPFQNEPDLRFYFDSASHRDAQRRVERGLRQQKGLTVMTGEGGTGKSLLARRLLDGLEEEVFEASMLVMVPGAADSQTVLRRYARQLGVEDPATDRSELLAQLYEQLAMVREDGRHAVLILDDAQVLTPEALGEVGGLVNLEYEDRRLLSLFLVGSPDLDVWLGREASLGQRVDVRVWLSPLDVSNTAAYVAQRLTVAGGSPGIVPDEALSALFKLGRGRARLLNTLADNALFEAYLGGRHEISGGDVERAAGDLGVGMEPGETYMQPPVPRELEAAPPPLAPVTASAAPVPSTPADPNAGEPVDLGELLDASADPESDFAAVLQTDLGAAGGTDDLDAEVEAALGGENLFEASEVDSLPLPVFQAESSAQPAVAEATRLAFQDEDPAQAESDLDDLFVELIDD